MMDGSFHIVPPPQPSVGGQIAVTTAPAAPRPAEIKRVVILGALSAIAIATARIYAAEGHILLLVARNKERLEALAYDLRARGAARVETAVLDLEAEAMNAPTHMNEWAERLDGIDHVHLIYGFLGTQAAASANPAALARITAANYSSSVQWCEAAANVFRSQWRGSLVAVSSVAGDRGRQSNYAYGAAKGGLAIYVQGLAHSLAGHGARAVAVKPGFVDTPMTDGLRKGGALWASPERVARVLRRAADKGGPIQYAPGRWRLIMLAVRSTPSALLHMTRI